MLIYDIANFTAFNEDQVDSGSHWTRRGVMEGDPTTWFCKAMRDPDAAKIEVLAQEFLRFLIPHQPATFLARDTLGTYYVLSEEVPGYQHLPKNQQKGFSNGNITGLGQALVGSVFLQEVDLKNGNIGIDNKNRVIKIDGDWCFAQFHTDYNNKEPFLLTPQMIESLPYPIDFPAFEWLDYIDKWAYQPFSQIVSNDLSHSEQFRSEVNQALLKICLVPNQFIEAFTDFYMPSAGNRFSDLIKSRRDELTQSALQNDSFNDYLKTQEAKDIANAMCEQMQSFQSADAPVINPDFLTRLTKEFDQLELLHDIWPNYPECKQLIGDLKDHSDPIDVPLTQFIADMVDRIEKNKNDPDELQNIRANLGGVSAIMNSAEFNAVKGTIAAFRAEFGFYMNEKAGKIEQALYNTPLNERTNVISNTTANEVQRALASHRHPFRDKPELPGGQIDYEKAATNFKLLKDKFKQSIEQPNEPEDGVDLKLK